MAKFHTADREFTKHLVEVEGLKPHYVEVTEGENPIKYFTAHDSGNQIKVNLKEQLITLLDKKGNFVDEDSAFSERQIQRHLHS